MTSNGGSVPKLELWKGQRMEGPYRWMVWSIDDDAPYWFREYEQADAYIEARQAGDSERADRLARSAE